MTTPPPYDPASGQFDPNTGQFGQPSGQFDPNTGQFGQPSGQFDPNTGQFGQPSGQFDPNTGQFGPPGQYGQAPGTPGGQPGFAMPNQMPGPSLAAATRQRGVRQVIIGAVLFAIGLVITIATYGSASSSPSGGTYFIAWGPMLFGVIGVIRGLVAIARAQKLN